MTARIEKLLREAAEWRLIGLLFECPSEEWLRTVETLAREIQDPDLQAAASKAAEEATEGTYHSILGPGGPAPAREVSYHNTLQLGYLVAEVTVYYDAFAYRPVTSEAIDHISVEAGFMSYLRVKEAFALSNGDEASAELVADASRSFMKSHLAYVAEPLSKSLEAPGADYLAAAGRALRTRVGACPVLPVIEPVTESSPCGEEADDLLEAAWPPVAAN